MRAIAIATSCVVLAVAGCGDSGGGSSSSESAAGSSTSVGRTMSAGKQKPEVEVPDIPRPTKLVVKDLEVGSGPRAKAGDKVRVEYVGVNWQGVRFADSWTYPSPPVFDLGGGTSDRLEYGLDLGVRGMRVGGRRKVITPPSLLYWPDEEHSPPKPVDTLVFIVDLLEVR